jgi:hypothetical protein
MTEPSDLVFRAEDGRFIAGQAPKSPGRPRGKTDSEKVREQLQPHSEEVIGKLIELAKLGDPNSIRVYMAYLAPPPRPEAERVTIPGLASAHTPKEKADSIVAAVASGAISFEAGERAMSLLARYMQAITATDHELRLRALEEGKPAGIEYQQDTDEVQQ